MAINVLLTRGDTAKINNTAITDGQLLYNTTTGQHYIDVGSTRKEVGKPVDSALSTTSTNAISNKAITTSIVNTTAEVNAITADYVPCGTKPVKELITKLANGNITFSVVNNIPYVKVGADSARPFSGNAQKKDIVAGVTTYTFDRDVVGFAVFGEDATTRYVDNCFNGKHIFGFVPKNTASMSDRYIAVETNGRASFSGKTVTITAYTSGYIIAYFE